MISIVIPTFNEELYLPLLVESIKIQDVDDYEIIVADNGSTDHTREIALRLGCRVIEGGKPAVARQKGGEAADKDIFFIDADVVMPKGFIESCLQKIKDKDLDLATCDVLPLSKRPSHLVFFFLKNLGVRVFHNFYSHAHGQCIYVKKELFEKTGFNLKLFHGDEHDFANRARKNGKFEILDGLYVYCSTRRLEKEGTFRLFIKTIYPEIVRFFNRSLDRQIVDYEWGKHT